MCDRPHPACTLPGHQGSAADWPGPTIILQHGPVPGPGAHEPGRGPAAGVPHRVSENLVVPAKLAGLRQAPMA